MCFINDFLFCRKKMIINDFVLIFFPISYVFLYHFVCISVFPSQTAHYDSAAKYGWGEGSPQLDPMMPRDARTDIRLIAVVYPVWKHVIKVAMYREK